MIVSRAPRTIIYTKIRRNRNLRALPWSGLLNKTRPLQRSSTVPLGTRSCTARRPQRHVRPGVPLRSVSQVRSAQPPLSAQATTGNTVQHKPRYALPQFVDTRPPLSARTTTGDTVQHDPVTLCPNTSRLSHPCQHRQRTGNTVQHSPGVRFVIISPTWWGGP